jgi:hypothetical protein
VIVSLQIFTATISSLPALLSAQKSTHGVSVLRKKDAPAVDVDSNAQRSHLGRTREAARGGHHLRVCMRALSRERFSVGKNLPCLLVQNCVQHNICHGAGGGDGGDGQAAGWQ